MPNIFKQAQQVNDHPKRNNFDLSKKINASFKFGTLYPVYCQPVVPGDSFSIDTAFNIKAMPVVFPVQTKMRAHMHYFYVRNKNLWKNWENWLSNLPNATQDLTPHPYVSRPDSEFANGSIHDFLGVPTSLVSHSVFAVSSSLTQSPGRPLNQCFYAVGYDPSFLGRTFGYLLENNNISWVRSDVIKYAWFGFSLNHPLSSASISVLSDYFSSLLLGSSIHNIMFFKSQDDSGLSFQDSDTLVMFFSSSINPYSFDDGNIVLSNEVLEYINSWDFSDSSLKICFYFGQNSSVVPSSSYDLAAFRLLVETDGVIEYPDTHFDLYSNHLHINVLPYRAYESIYNAYYRNTVVDPLKVNDQVLYNKFIPNDGDGADTYLYQLHQRNYELDFLTSALPSPQQGVAPMVGVTALGDITIEDENGITTARTESDEAGYVTKVVLTSPAASNDHARLLMNIAASGFNINDFRNTNALQRFLETSIRKGYKYKDFIAGHFGVEPKYVELDMPEFIGGFTRDVAVSTVVSNADTLGDNSGAALGEYGGFAQVVGGSRHSVRHYCDDYGFIMGILCITPTPCYSQLLPKHMVAPDNFLDYYFAEFSNIGMQPITYKEVAPIQSYIDSLLDPDKHLEDTFGYQRPNYDMVAAVDEVHGDFRGSLRNYVINRIFDHRPELGHDFIAIRPDEVNDIFVDTDPRDDTFIGEIGFSVHAKRPVPRVVIPNLGR